MLVPAIIICMLGSGVCITYRLEPVATFGRCQEEVLARAGSVQAKFPASWIYGFECS